MAESPRSSADCCDADQDLAAIARRLRKHPDLADVIDVWPLLNEPIRQAIMQLIGVKR